MALMSNHASLATHTNCVDAGLVAPLGGGSARPGSAVGLAQAGSGGALRLLPPDLLGLCTAVDEKAAALLLARDQALLSATAALQVRFASYLGQVWRSACIHSPCWRTFRHRRWCPDAFPDWLLECLSSFWLRPHAK